MNYKDYSDGLKTGLLIGWVLGFITGYGFISTLFILNMTD